MNDTRKQLIAAIHLLEAVQPLALSQEDFDIMDDRIEKAEQCLFLVLTYTIEGRDLGSIQKVVCDALGLEDADLRKPRLPRP
jgi:hypothetical protein